MDKQKRIAVIGAGAAGLSAAYFLKEQGYTNVTVFESSDRVGGKCKSTTYEGRAYEGGAFTVTRSYKEVCKLLKKLHLQTTLPPPRQIIENHGHKFIYKDMQNSLTRPFSTWQILRASGRYLWLCFKYRRLKNPGFTHLDPNLSLPFTEWAKKEKLEPIVQMFLLPITLFGYGDLHVIPAAYVLKYMNWIHFTALLSICLFNYVGTRRIIEGYGKIWEKLAPELHIRLNSKITRIERQKSITLHLDQGEKLQFDELIIACPCKELFCFLDLSAEETELFSKVKTYQYFVTTFRGKGLPNRCLYTVPLPKEGYPYMIYKPWAENDIYVAYSFSEKEMSKETVSQRLEEEIHDLGGKVEATLDQILWNYFPHVSSQEMGSGFYDKLEALQGKNHTYYAGSTFAFETVELVVHYSKNLVEKRFTA